MNQMSGTAAAPVGLSHQTPQAMVTVVCRLDDERLTDVQAAIDRLGNPANPDLTAALRETDPGSAAGTHFASLHAFVSRDGKRPYLLLELSGDGDADAALARVARALGPSLRPIIIHARDWRDGGDLLGYLTRHRVPVGAGWFDNPGLCFCGTPGLSVGRIRFEERLARRVTEILAGQTGNLAALDRLGAVRAELRGDPAWGPALAPADTGRQDTSVSAAALVLPLALSFIRTFLWPAALAVALWAIGSALRAGGRDESGAMLTAGLSGLWTAAWIAVLLVALGFAAAYLLLRRAEAEDPLDDRLPDVRTNAAMFERENHCAQNHMLSITERKPGILRAFTARLVFWVIGELAARSFRPGFLGEISSIHFARWVTMPGSPDLIFLSNYDGSWESYLEDFITRAHDGLTGVWSNTVFFPRSENLVGKGATDGERFKRFARRSMVPSRFWFTAYPELTTRIIRTNAEIRRGLSGSMTEDEATCWLALFGSAARPPSKLVSSEIQSLVFGGLGFMPFGTCLVFDLPDGAAARDWLAAVQPYVAFNDGRRLRHPAVVTLALGAGGLSRLGLPDSAVETFPFAFNAGMVGRARARMLGDTGSNAAEYWRWGRTQPDAILLLYGLSQDEVDALEALMRALAGQAGVAAIHTIPLAPVAPGKAEPFGFADGISQPVIRGTYKGLRSGDPIHLVEPGEFILGYPNNRGSIEPGPVLPALADPVNLLPLVGGCAGFDRARVEAVRDLGFNGSFLVVRELEQDVDGFAAYCRKQADKLAEMRRLGEPYPLVVAGSEQERALAAEFVGAKMVGRWKDGSSIVRYPYEPLSVRRALAAVRAAAEETAARAAGSGPAAPPQGAAARESLVARVAARARSGADPVEAAPAASVRNAATGDNDFLLGAEDPEGLRCPFGAHMRRSNPRDSFDPGSDEAVGIVNRHRILRVGRPYAPAVGARPGLLFMCLNGDIERQFELVQQDWLRSASFHGLANEKDPLLGDGAESGFTIPTRDGPVVLDPLPTFVTVRGGGYFFLPGKRLLEYLARGR